MRNKTSPRLFFVLRMLSVLVRPLSWLLAPRPLSLPLGCRRLSPLCLSLGGAWGGAWSVVPSCGAIGVVAHRSFPMSVCGTAERLAACLRSSSRRSVRAAGRLPLRGSSRLIDAGGEIGFLCLLGWSGECGDYVNYRLSVDCFGTGVYINTRALIGFSFRCFLARACCVGGFSVLLLPPIALVYAPMNWFLRGTNGSDFFYRFSFHLISSLGCFAC